MFYAEKNAEKIEAQPGFAGACCPCCKREVLAKCGEIKVWHWAHTVRDCDPWHESETEWHKNWKERFPFEWREVTKGNHRADVSSPAMVLELQHSSISVEEIREREAFYGAMVWLFDMRGKNQVTIDSNGAFLWQFARASILSCKRPVFLQLEEGIILNVFDYGRHRAHPDIETTWTFGCYEWFSVEQFVELVSGRGERAATLPQTAKYDSRAFPGSILKTSLYQRLMYSVESAARDRNEHQQSFLATFDANIPKVQTVNGQQRCSCGAPAKTVPGSGSLVGRTLYLCSKEPMAHRRMVGELAGSGHLA